jgi:hypothetical protein
VAKNKDRNDVGLKKQHLEYHNSWDCWYGFGYCVVMLFAVLTDGRWKLAAHIVTPLDVNTVA